MGYHHVVPADLEPALDGPSTKRAIGDASGLSRLAARVCEVAPGEEVPLAYHDNEHTTALGVRAPPVDDVRTHEEP